MKTMLTFLLTTLPLLLAPTAAQATGEIRPEAFGAIAGDGIPDNAAVQAAFAVGGALGSDVVLGGLYEIQSRANQTNLGNPWRTFAVHVTGNVRPVLIRAENGGGLTAVGDWFGSAGYLLTVYKNGAPVTFRDIYLDMSQRCAGIDENAQNCRDEQQHAMELDLGAQHVRLEDVTIYHPSLGVSAGGDCVRMVGGYTDADLVRDIYIRGLVGISCDRSLLSFQRSVHQVTAEHLTSFYAEDNDIDMEATGTDPNDELTWIQDVTIRSALVVKNGGNGITLGRGIRIRVIDSAVIGGAVFALSCRDCLIAGSTFMQAPTSVDAPIGVIRASERVKILNNRIGRLAGSTTTSPLVYVAANNGSSPRDTLIQGNDLAVTYNAPALRADNAEVTVALNTFRFTGALPTNQNAVAAVFQSLQGGPPVSTLVTGNRFLGAWQVAAQVSGTATWPVGSVVVTSNVFDGARTALRCVNWALAFPTFPVRTGNWKNSAALDDCPIATTGY